MTRFCSLGTQAGKGGEYMGSFGGFYKGDKKKPKQKNKKGEMSMSSAPVFVMPKQVEKKKKTA